MADLTDWRNIIPCESAVAAEQTLEAQRRGDQYAAPKCGNDVHLFEAKESNQGREGKRS